MNSKERCFASINGENVDRTPVFPLLMFFSQKRAGITYREFATNGRAMADAQLAIAENFSIDAVTACTDAFRITADLGAEMSFPDDKPPFSETPLITSEEELGKMANPDPTAEGSRMRDRCDGISYLVDGVGESHLVLGWIDMPFAEACSICGVTNFMMMMVDNPDLAHKILEFITDIVIDFSKAQLEAGAPMLGAGDAAASLVSPAQYLEFALPYEKRIVEAVHNEGGLLKLHICGNTGHLLKDMVQCGADLFNVDHMVDFELACEVYGNANKCFKGNLDPVGDLMQSTPEKCDALCKNLIKRAEGLRYMLSPGCEVPAETSDEVFRAFCDSSKS